ncbi:MAG: orotidine-5'-phosphate decarboxylase [bacterium]|nr:orotidine-5'-phosphate decarboxylase [bacterium]
MSVKLIVALDFAQQSDALNLIDTLSPNTCALKVGSEMFTQWGPQFVKQLVDKKYKVFLDLKFHDIPNTVAKACQAAADLGVWMMNVHAVGGLRMMHAASKAIESYGINKPLLIGVTVLTSFNEQELLSVGVTNPLINQTLQLAQLAQDAGLDGVVSSAHEVCAIKRLCPTPFITVTPGIRLTNHLEDDQVRIMTPKQAIECGSDYIVVGRPITRANNPALVINEILNDIY